ncbi:helix-turn-helix transcriptional regulator [Roseicitreum antarcticum]|uniref:HTH domain-containing protein n=1 Tax=Roseicitreum antarcticum TaxID=564137 RepID=A0A1H3A1E6_9RHOB|nr:HTH domain-containing protein [Roseicitreum antarcticum]SDX23446.1 HTH domain-containing protein [Roseicitreum antarcticum]
MKRDERLYALVQILRDGKLRTAQELARAMGVSTRTIWRDMAIMAQTGLPIEGERGLGYVLRAPLVLPPVMLTADELAALMGALGAVAEDDAHPQARPARSLLNKVLVLLPQAGVAPE